MNDPLFVPRTLPNKAATADYLQKTYGPQAQKTFLGALEAFLCTEFPQLAGGRARRAIAQALTELVYQFFPATSHLRPGQTSWVSVAKDETSAYGKTISQTRMVSVIVTLLAADEAQQRRDGKRLRDLKRDTVARICQETDAGDAVELTILHLPGGAGVDPALGTQGADRLGLLAADVGIRRQASARTSTSRRAPADPTPSRRTASTA